MRSNNDIPPVQIHFSREFPIETRCLTSEEEYAVVEVLKVEYGLDENGENYDITLFVSGIKAFSMSDDDQECFIKWSLKDYSSSQLIEEGTVGTGRIEMGERYTDRECIVKNIPAGEYLFDIEYV